MIGSRIKATAMAQYQDSLDTPRAATLDRYLELMTMQLFELPDFYVPWPVGLNSNIGPERANSGAGALVLFP